MAHVDTRRCCCCWWFLMVVYFLWLPNLLLAKRNSDETAEKCRVYCIKCTDAHMTPQALLGDALEVSLQVTPQGELPYALIILNESKPSTNLMVNQENVTLRVKDKEEALLTLPGPRPAFSWVTFVLARPTKDTMLFYTPENRMNVLTDDVVLGPTVSVSSNRRIHVAFNCLSGCFMRSASSALIGGGSSRGGEEAALQAPFTLYLQPAPRPLQPSNHAVTPTLTLTHNMSNGNVTVKANNWAPDRWYRVEVLVGPKEKTGRVEMNEQQQQDDDVREVTVWVEDGAYKLTTLKGFTSWTLHCPPQGLAASTATPQPQDRRITRKPATTSTQSPGPTNGNEGEGTGGGSSNTKPKPKPSRGGAGAGEVVAWVLAGLALFMVMVLALALCTKMRSPTHAQNFQDFPASVGVVSFKDMGTREPEEMSEPDTPTLTVPHHYKPPTANHYPVTSCKAEEG